MATVRAGLMRILLVALFSACDRTSRTITSSGDLVANGARKPFAPCVVSGTFNFFVDHVLDGDEQSILNLPGIVTSEDDEILHDGSVANPYAIGYFGYAYYKADQGKLRALSIDNREGAVAPTRSTAQSGRYPLARPLFISSSQELLREKSQPHVAAFVSYYLQYVDLQIDDVGYFTASRTTSEQVRAALVAVLQSNQG